MKLLINSFLIVFLLNSIQLSQTKTVETTLNEKNKFEIIALELKEQLKTNYPNIKIIIERDKNEPEIINFQFIEEKFSKLYSVQRFHFLEHNISSEYMKKLKNEFPTGRWYELAPDEKIADLKYPITEEIDNITDNILKLLVNKHFFKILDDRMCPIDSLKTPQICMDDFSISKKILKELGFKDESSEYDEMFDIFSVLMNNGAFCDCEILYNIPITNRLKTKYWETQIK